MEFGVIVHGGAWDIPDDAVENHLCGVRAACKLAYDFLEDGTSAIDAAEACVRLMEQDPTFDAGKGSFVNQLGEVEMDAIIATDEYRIGSVCGIQNVFHPISVARKIMDTTKHVMLVGEGANIFAREQQIPECNPEDLLVGRELQRYHAIKEMKHFEPKEAFGSYQKTNGMGTVGCVCLDKSHNIAIAVSTGGTPFKRPGRVGDTPLWGSGGYVESIGGVAATGYGEDLMRVMISRQSIDFIRKGYSPQEAADLAITLLGEKVNGLGGIIILNEKGIGFSFNTPRMAYAFRSSDDDSISSGINPNNDN
ncbi:hypothetical protein NEF87_001326 [Candidatus Lokiarchaeum ossiferum]|uniref:Plant-type L-asparaginase n=1 Tax=Candidatus Lokiarchaeum ossiferum TaxID=2951803 RepID=A0ABY6HNF1_9ARCH|nr:hypothetical protein NEF87_001326 [Candidatus Lokiarchaeum sp. B-35]